MSPLTAAECPRCRAGVPHFGQADWEAHRGRLPTPKPNGVPVVEVDRSAFPAL